MSNRGVLSKIWNNFRQSFTVIRAKDSFVGTDYLGNRYFERLGDVSKGIKPQRRYEAPKRTAMHDVPEVPVEWMTWLQGRRKDPPLQQEIEKNMAVSARTQARARELNSSKDATAAVGDDVNSVFAQKRPFPTYEDLERSPGEREDALKNKKS